MRLKQTACLRIRMPDVTCDWCGKVVARKRYRLLHLNPDVRTPMWKACYRCCPLCNPARYGTAPPATLAQAVEESAGAERESAL